MSGKYQPQCLLFFFGWLLCFPQGELQAQINGQQISIGLNAPVQVETPIPKLSQEAINSLVQSYTQMFVELMDSLTLYYPFSFVNNYQNHTNIACDIYLELNMAYGKKSPPQAPHLGELTATFVDAYTGEMIKKCGNYGHNFYQSLTAVDQWFYINSLSRVIAPLCVVATETLEPDNIRVSPQGIVISSFENPIATDTSTSITQALERHTNNFLMTQQYRKSWHAENGFQLLFQQNIHPNYRLSQAEQGQGDFEIKASIQEKDQYYVCIFTFWKNDKQITKSQIPSDLALEVGNYAILLDKQRIFSGDYLEFWIKFSRLFGYF